MSDEDEYVTDKEEEEIVASEGVLVDHRDVINNNISISLLTIKGIYVLMTFDFYSKFHLILINFSQVQV